MPRRCKSEYTHVKENQPSEQRVSWLAVSFELLREHSRSLFPFIRMHVPASLTFSKLARPIGVFFFVLFNSERPSILTGNIVFYYFPLSRSRLAHLYRRTEGDAAASVLQRRFSELCRSSFFLHTFSQWTSISLCWLVLVPTGLRTSWKQHSATLSLSSLSPSPGFAPCLPLPILEISAIYMSTLLLRYSPRLSLQIIHPNGFRVTNSIFVMTTHKYSIARTSRGFTLLATSSTSFIRYVTNIYYAHRYISTCVCVTLPTFINNCPTSVLPLTFSLHNWPHLRATWISRRFFLRI